MMIILKCHDKREVLGNRERGLGEQEEEWNLRQRRKTSVDGAGN